ncbi:type II toxin-antitoxin system death-on-curing family toxin [Acaricomes phytoseiuli]|uniref:type II toxin-antitoxin system death-on-curing family toxin n=1 Tax=Acaricomes phytoseiuli TaxID=291968 RepID=UPI0003A10E7D|nr:type II toxin-antitoxin system death-on-curing family toxin [Acaricomes phytoseiuli]
MIYFLDRDDVLTAGAVALGHSLNVRDFGLLDSAVARPASTLYGIDAYPSLLMKASALLQSLARNHAFVDGNKRTAWASCWVFLEVNGIVLGPSFDVDEAERFMNQVAISEAPLHEIAEALAGFAEARSS